MSSSPRLPDLTAADAGRCFVLRPGSSRTLVLDLEPPGVGGVPGQPPAVTSQGPVEVTEDREPPPGRRRLVITAQARGSATVQVGKLRWDLVIRGAAHTAEQTRDDTDVGWGESRSGHSAAWWQEQRPPHW